MRISSSLEQWVLASVAAALVAAVVLPIVGHVNSWIGFATATGCFVATFAIARYIPAGFTGGRRRHPILATTWFVLAILAVAQIGRLSAFMADSSRLWGSTVPDPSAARHQCLSAYVYAADLSRRGEQNIYDGRLYPAFTQSPSEPTGMDSPVIGLGPWIADPYQYPPPFLLLPRIALILTSSFEAIRASWFVLQTLAFLIGGVLLAGWVGGQQGRTVALLIPLVLMSIPTMLNLQFGQFHGMVFLLALASLVAFEHEKPVLGGALLAFAILAKIFPAVLLLGLAARRHWREVRWTIGCGAVISVVAFLILGRDPFVAFLSYQLPRLADGSAFSFIQRVGTPVFFTSRNYAIGAVVPKLRLLGAHGLPLRAGTFLSAIFAVLVFVFAWRSPRGDDPRLQRVQRWLALLNLASLCSPLAPSAYVVATTLWLLALLAAEIRSQTLPALGLGMAWVVVMGPPPLPDMVDLAVSLGAQALLVAINVWALVRPVPTGLASGFGGSGARLLAGARPRRY